MRYELCAVIDEVLHYRWDPIGIAGSCHARDEYSGYVQPLCELLAQGADAMALSEYLGEIAVVGMGMSPNPSHDLGIAEEIMKWDAFIRAQTPAILGER